MIWRRSAIPYAPYCFMVGIRIRFRIKNMVRIRIMVRIRVRD